MAWPWPSLLCRWLLGVCWRVRHRSLWLQVMGLYEKDDNQSLHESVQIYEMVLAQTKDLKALTKLQARGPPTPPSTHLLTRG